MTWEAHRDEVLRETARRVEARRTRVWYVVIVGFVGVLVGIALAFAFIIQSSKDQRRATCAVVAANQEVFRETPPTTETGRNAQRAWNDLYKTLGCKETPPPPKGNP